MLMQYEWLQGQANYQSQQFAHTVFGISTASANNSRFHSRIHRDVAVMMQMMIQTAGCQCTKSLKVPLLRAIFRLPVAQN